MKGGSRENIATILINAHLVDDRERAIEASRNLLGLCTVCAEIASENSGESNDEARI